MRLVDTAAVSKRNTAKLLTSCLVLLTATQQPVLAEDPPDLHIGETPLQSRAFGQMVKTVGINASTLGVSFENGPKSTMMGSRADPVTLDEFVQMVGLDISTLKPELESDADGSKFRGLPQFIFCSVHQRYERRRSFGRMPSVKNLSFYPYAAE